MKILVRAPSNIALIKYMGKRDSALNLPENGSLSMTLEALCTYVEVEVCFAPREDTPRVQWLPELPSDIPDDAAARLPRLSGAGLAKVVRHAERVLAAVPALFAHHGIELRAALLQAHFILRSANTFPEASGIASSASAFAGFTLAMAAACAIEGQQRIDLTGGVALRRALAALSRLGSGSSCRSFEGPFVKWSADGERMERVGERWTRDADALAHFVVLVSSEAKSVSSSEAHTRVKTSPLWQGRVSRVDTRLRALEQALQHGDFERMAALTWEESWEMHSLFHTARPPFTYWRPGSLEVLEWVRPFVERGEVIATMDAGPNVHLIVRASTADAWRVRLIERFGGSAILQDRPGQGAQVLT